jgi:hypothetical protein
MAVRLDIRPRLVLRDEPVAKARRRMRLPPLTFPALGYWLAMGALTYFFAHMGEYPLDSAFASSEPEAPGTTGFEPEPAPAALPPTPPPTPAPALPPLPEPSPQVEPASEPAPTPDPHPTRALADRHRDRDRDRGQHRDRDRDWKPDRDAVVRSEAPLAEPAPRVAMSFPEFTDSSRPTTRERAASGPRIDLDLFGEAPEPPARPEPGPDTSRAPDTDAARPAVALSCEAAIARNREEVTIGGPRGPADITRGAYASILENGRYLSGCSIPERTVFEVCTAVQNGRAVGITVASNPPSAAVNSCVRSAVSRLKFPANPRLDVTRTRFDALRR